MIDILPHIDTGLTTDSLQAKINHIEKLHMLNVLYITFSFVYACYKQIREREREREKEQKNEKDR